MHRLEGRLIFKFDEGRVISSLRRLQESSAYEPLEMGKGLVCRGELFSKLGILAGFDWRERNHHNKHTSPPRGFLCAGGRNARHSISLRKRTDWRSYANNFSRSELPLTAHQFSKIHKSTFRLKCRTPRSR